MLKRAETRGEGLVDDGDGRMFGFKVASLAVGEDDAVKSAMFLGPGQMKTVLHHHLDEFLFIRLYHYLIVT